MSHTIDLHIHTKFSDGAKSPKEILEIAEEKKGDIISVTDHNSVGAYPEIFANRQLFSGKIVPGCELSCFCLDTFIEIIAYGIDLKKIAAVLDEKYDPAVYHKKQNEAIRNMLAEKKVKFLPERFDEISKRSGIKWALYNEFLQIPENISFLNNPKNIKSYQDFFRNELYSKDGGLFVDYSTMIPSGKELCDQIHEWGGLAFLAHPYVSFSHDKTKVETAIKETPLDGVECKYASFSKDEQKKLMKLAQKYGKFISGGSDYHGIDRRPSDLFTGVKKSIDIKYEDIAPWIEKIKTI